MRYIYLLLIAVILSGCAGLFGDGGLVDISDLGDLKVDEIASGEKEVDWDQIAGVLKTLGRIAGISPDQIDVAINLLKGDTGTTSKSKPVTSEPEQVAEGNKKKFQPKPILPNFPVHVVGNCTEGTAIIQVTNIPVMTDANKDEINKQMFFSLVDEAGHNMLGVFHRYLQPDWPYGPWEPTWRFESGNCNCVEEWHIYQSHPLPDSTATFSIVWRDNIVRVRCDNTGDEQTLHLRSKVAFSDVSDDSPCWSNEEHSRANIRKISWNGTKKGNPGPCN